jgi:hypothetical protein
MSSYDGGWDEDFPPVMHFVDLENACARPWKFLEAHPDYDAAKNHEDRAAALRLVHDFLRTPENQKQLRFISQKYPNAILVSVHAMEEGGKNRIPQMLADYMGSRTGLEVDDSIIQTNRVHRTGSDEWHRFAFRPSFDGPVRPACKYILVDDVFTHGGSFNELRLHIERNGGKVVQTAAVSLGGHGDKIAPELELMKSLIDKFGADKLNFFLKEIGLYDGNYKSLTNPETFALRRAPSLDEARNRILAARQTRSSSVGTESDQETQSQASIINPQNNNPHRGRSI